MIGATAKQETSLEKHSPTLFLVAGVLLTGYAVLNGIKAFTVMAVEPNLFEFGYVIGFLGLFGLYPQLADRRPRLAHTGAVAAAFGAVAISAFNIGELAKLTGIAPNGLPGMPVFVFMALIGFVLGYLAFGVASLRSNVYSRSIGIVLLVPGIIVILMLAHIAAGLDSLETAFVISAGQAMAHLAIGATLRAEAKQADYEDIEGETASDATARG